jgi:C4-dicarboxylate-specific signal transduction histidine kinase
MQNFPSSDQESEYEVVAMTNDYICRQCAVRIMQRQLQAQDIAHAQDQAQVQAQAQARAQLRAQALQDVVNQPTLLPAIIIHPPVL